MFRSVTGGATGSMFLLNWAEFNGNGVTVREDHRAGRRGRARVPATLSLSLGTPGDVRRVHAGRGAHVRGQHHGQRDLDGG